MENGRLMVEETTGGKPPATLIQCSIPGCTEGPLPKPEFEAHLLFHADPVEEEPETIEAHVDEEGVHVVTVVGEVMD